MGFWFHKAIQILPGVRANMTQNGLSSITLGSGRVGVTLNRNMATLHLRLGNGLHFNKSFRSPLAGLTSQQPVSTPQPSTPPTSTQVINNQ